MFHAQAYSFHQQARLAISLTWIAGYTNALTILTCTQVTSHLTGIVSELGVQVAETQWSAAGYLGGLLGMFLAGAVLSGLLVEYGRARHFHSIYVLPMACEAALLATFALLVDWRATQQLADADARIWLTFVPSFAMGLQNATITRISGGVVRTTHVTGVVTDLGLELSKHVFRILGIGKRAALVHAEQEGLRALLLASILASFALGAGLGTVAYDHFVAWSMLPAVAFLVGLTVYDLTRPVRPVTLRALRDTLPPGVLAFAAEPPASGQRYRLPDLAAWGDTLAADGRIVLIDISRLPRMGERSAQELLSLMLRLRPSGRQLVLAGVEKQQLTILDQVGALTEMDTNNICHDVASAVRRCRHLLEAARATDRRGC